MRVLMIGATGFVGRALLLRLLRDGHKVVAWARSPDAARSSLGAEVEVADARLGQGALATALESTDAVINLAGEPVAGARWTKARRASIVQSRVVLTNDLVAAMTVARKRPAVLVNASAVGYYGDRGDQPLDESSEPGRGFLAETCVAWENAACAAEPLGVRVVRARLGVVLGLGGGFLGKLWPIFSRGLGARLGDGKQYLPFCHLDDVIEVMVTALGDARYQGAIDLVAPQSVTMTEVTDALARATGKTAKLAVPALALKLALGEAAEVVLGSQRLAARRLRDLGFRHRFADIDAALGDLAARMRGIEIKTLDDHDPPPMGPGAGAGSAGAETATPAGVAGTGAPHPRGYLEARPPRYLLRTRIKLQAAIEDVFAFFSRPENLGIITPAAMAFRMQKTPGSIAAGQPIDYGIRVGGAGLRWRTIIEHWVPGRYFVDAQAKGPYRSWWHEHHFTAEGDATVMEDRVYFAPPLGPLGRAAQALYIGSQLRQIFGYRAQAIGQRFHAVEAA